MKVNASIPSETLIASLLSIDPLRSKADHTSVEKLSSTEFCQDLISRINYARFDPRLMESLIERIVLFPLKLDLLFLLKNLSEMPWPHVLTVALDFSISVIPDSEKDKNLKCYLIALREGISKGLKAPQKLESFYIALYPPASKRVQQALLNASKCWTKNGYWALSSPYSKELIALYSDSKKILPKLNSKFLAQTLKQVLARHSGENMTLEQIRSELDIQISPRQLLRHLTKLGIKKTGRVRGTRYKAVTLV